MPRKNQMPHVAVWVETSRGYARGLVRGIADYVREHGAWSIYFTPHGLDDPLPGWLRKWKGDGILARIANKQSARILLATKLPLIDLSCRLPELELSNYGIDNKLVAQMAFQHLREREFRNYGFYGMPQGEHLHMDQRCVYFSESVEKAGFDCRVYEARLNNGNLPSWEKQQKHIGKWLLALPKPIGIMCCNDDHALQLLNACRQVMIGVPDEVAVIGVDNDEELCRLATHPISSVDINSHRIGYKAAAALDKMMETGETDVPHDILFKPSHVVRRLSTDTLAIEDPVLARALRFIRDHACENISVSDVVKASITSRRHLEKQMESLLGRSPNREILRVRIRRAQELLCETDLSLESIARQSGFTGRKYMGDVFVRETGETPGHFRSKARNY